MKRFLFLAAACLMSIAMSGQAQITTKKMKLEDFPEKITKIVLPGNMFRDVALKDEIQNHWNISPFEFCSSEEFEALKTSPDYYFLLVVESRFRKESEPGLEFLSLVKGGPAATKGIEEMLEVVSMPFCSVEYPSGRELTFLPAFIDIIQAHVLASMEKDVNAYAGLSNYSLNMASAKNMDIVFSEDDLSEGLTLPATMKKMTEEETDEYLIDRTPDTLVSYVVAPTEAKPGSYCYKMLIDSGTHTLYYFRRHRISKKYGPGFLSEDILRITK